MLTADRVARLEPGLNQGPAPLPTAPAGGGPRLPYLPGLDGLRAVAVMAVLIYHANTSWLPGGFLGVDVFFVISGYLITSLLVSERQREGKVALGTFYVRRARRLLPALFVTLFLVVVGAMFLRSDALASLRGDVAAALTYSSNWYFVVAQKSYAEGQSLLNHLWSLAIEEQFYLVWPLLLAGLLKLFGGRRILVAGTVIAGAAASVVAMAVMYSRIDLYAEGGSVAVDRLYYGTDTRASGLLIGAALSLVWSPWRLRPRVARSAPMVLDLVGVAALLGLISMFWMTPGHQAGFLYMGGFVLVSVLTAGVIAVTAHPAAHLAPLLGNPVFRWIGLRSYGIYLFHYPLFSFLTERYGATGVSLQLFAIEVAVTFAVAELSFRFVESPIRHGALGRQWKAMRAARGERRATLRHRWLLSGAAVLLAVSALAVVLVRAEAPNEVPEFLSATGTELTIPDDPLASDPSAALTDPAAGPAPVAAAGSTVPTTATTLPALPTVNGGPVTTAAPAAPSTAPTTGAAPETTPAPADGGPGTTFPPLPKGSVRGIGDSVMLGASPVLKSAFGPAISIDAAVGRQVDVAIGILRRWQANGQLPDVVVVHMGNNGTFTDQQFDEMMKTLADVRKVVFVNVKVPRSWQDSVDRTIGEGVKRYGNAVLVDWYGASINRPELFAKDSIHLNTDGANLYTHLVRSAIG